MFTAKAVKPTPWREPSEFAKSHCMKCAAGWTRLEKGGRSLVVCLLDRDPVFAETVNCDRFEAREEQPA